MVIESITEGMLFSFLFYVFSKYFVTDSGRIENLLTLLTLPTCPATYPLTRMRYLLNLLEINCK